MPDMIETVNNVNKVANDLDLTARTNAILDYLGDNVKEGTELVKDQLPLVAQDVISWGIWSNFTRIIVIVLLSVKILSGNDTIDYDSYFPTNK